MLDIINFIREFIRVDIILAFGLYSILFFIVRLFFKDKSKLNQFDKSATQLLIYVGIVYSVVWMSEVILTYFLHKESIFTNRTGAYNFMFWTRPVFALIPILLLKITFLRKSLIYRILLFIYFLTSISQCVIIITSFHRSHSLIIDYSFGLSVFEMIFYPVIKITFFVSIVILFEYLKKNFNSTEQ